MADWYWSWILTIVGVTGFYFVAQKKWWAWFINIGCQFLWLAYALITEQYGFIAASAIYFVVFSRNAYKWTREHREDRKRIDALIQKPWPGLIEVPEYASFMFKDVVEEVDNGVRVIKDARFHDVSLVAEPPHPSWTVQSVDRDYFWRCTNPFCRIRTYRSPERVGRKTMAGDQCPECGDRSQNKDGTWLNDDILAIGHYGKPIMREV